MPGPFRSAPAGGPQAARRSAAAPPFGPGHYVYRLWSTDRRCLYVGAAGARGKPVPLTERLRRAYRDNDWSAEVAFYDWAVFGSSAAAAAEERIQIQTLSPVYNQVMRMCRAGLHDVTMPGSQTADGKCTECTCDRMAGIFLPGANGIRGRTPSTRPGTANGSGFMTHGLRSVTREMLMFGTVPSWSSDFDDLVNTAIRARQPGGQIRHPWHGHRAPAGLGRDTYRLGYW